LIIQKLQVENFRNLQAVELKPHSRLNYLHGANGAGKTSILEALVVLSRGRSFRTTQAAELIGPSGSTFRVFAQVEDPPDSLHRLGLERSGNRWRGRKDGQEVSQLSQLTRSLPLVLMDPDSHLLVSGPPDLRRRYMDWGMFHVERGFLECWRSFSKALKQRNAALRRQQDSVLDSLDAVLVQHAEHLDRYRAAYCRSISRKFQSILTDLSSNQATISLHYQRGWSTDNYGQLLRQQRTRDLERGMTTRGPHRADLGLLQGNAAARGVLSRGEQKLVAAALLLTQAELLREIGQTPLILLDDLASEFDRRHFEQVLQRAEEIGGQVWVTGTRTERIGKGGAVFHVEQGRVTEVV